MSDEAPPNPWQAEFDRAAEAMAEAEATIRLLRATIAEAYEIGRHYYDNPVDTINRIQLLLAAVVEGER